MVHQMVQEGALWPSSVIKQDLGHIGATVKYIVNPVLDVGI